MRRAAVGLMSMRGAAKAAAQQGMGAAGWSLEATLLPVSGLFPDWAEPTFFRNAAPGRETAMGFAHDGGRRRASAGAVALEWSEVEKDFRQVGKADDATPESHPSRARREKGENYFLMNPVYTKEYVESVKPKHIPPMTFRDRAAFATVQVMRFFFDKLTGYGPNMDEKKWLRRVLFLETVAGVPGMVGGMLRHLRSLRTMQRDHGWIHTLLEEAENERMHLLTFLQLRQPGPLFRATVLFTQGVFFNLFFTAYLFSPSFCHRFVGYLEEEAVKTYTHCLHDIDTGKLPSWQNKKVPEIAIKYWLLKPEATLRDLILAIRADEQCHSHVNHTFSSMPSDQTNPFDKNSHTVP